MDFVSSFFLMFSGFLKSKHVPSNGVGSFCFCRVWSILQGVCGAHGYHMIRVIVVRACVRAVLSV